MHHPVKCLRLRLLMFREGRTCWWLGCWLISWTSKSKVVLRSCISENYISIILIWCLPQNYLIESHRVAARTRKTAARMLTTSARESSARRSSGRWRSTWAACTSSRRGPGRAPTPRATSSTSATSRTRSRAWTALSRMSSRTASEMTRGACARIWSGVVTTQQ